MQNKVRLILGIVVVVFFLSIFFSFLSVVGVKPFAGCYLRYQTPQKMSNTVSLSLYGSAFKQVSGTNGAVTNQYGKWTKVDLDLIKNAGITVSAVGEVSLCKRQYNGQKIPRTSEVGADLAIPFPAANQAITLTTTYLNDQLQVKIGSNSTAASTSITISGDTQTRDCSQGKTTYDPICGRYSPYVGTYKSFCSGTPVFTYWRASDYCCRAAKQTGHPWYSNCNNLIDYVGRSINDLQGYDCQRRPEWDADILVSTSCTYGGITYRKSNIKVGYDEGNYCTKTQSADMPLPYSNATTFLATDSINTSWDPTACPGGSNIAPSDSWFTFDQINGSDTHSGLFYSMPGVSNQYASIINNCTTTTCASGTHTRDERVILDTTNTSGSGSLSYRVYTAPSGMQYTGGYILYLKQTACRRINGSYYSDDYNNRGAIEYLLVNDANADPNTNFTPPATVPVISFDANGNSTGNPIIPSEDGYMWLRIRNNSSDYADSSGSYEVKVTQSIDNKVADLNLWTWIYDIFSKTFNGVRDSFFKNLTCYGSSSPSSNCNNFFNLIKACCILYIMIFAAYFSVGMINMNVYDFIWRIVKVIFVARLISGGTFDWFNNNVFGLVNDFRNGLMSSAVFYFNSAQAAADPINALFSEVFGVIGQEIFQKQLLALLATGFSGVVTFMLVCISTVLFLVPILNLMVVVLVSYFFVSLLLGLAPLFLVAVLFKPTRPIFDNWIRYLLLYIFEPVIGFVGISILAKLFLIYIDYVLGYSVCWKCIAVLQIPFIGSFSFFSFLTEKMPIFCLYWLAPWGYDPMTYNYGMSLTNIIALFAIANTAYHYSSMSKTIVSSIFGVSDPTGGAASIWNSLKGVMTKAYMAATGAGGKKEE